MTQNVHSAPKLYCERDELIMEGTVRRHPAQVVVGASTDKPLGPETRTSRRTLCRRTQTRGSETHGRRCSRHDNDNDVRPWYGHIGATMGAHAVSPHS